MYASVMSPVLAAARLLVMAALTLAVAGTAMAQDSYRVRPGDVLRIEVVEDPSLNRTALVAPDGRISMPGAGAVRASGRSLEAIQTALIAALSDDFANPPTVSVGLEALAQRVERAPAPDPTIDIFVIGEVGSAGPKTMAPGTTLLQAFSAMGGFSRFAATTRIQLRRTAANGAETVYEINYDAILEGRSPNGSVTLQDGDVIIVPQRRLFE